MDLPFKISTLVFACGTDGRILLLERRREPNRGCWSPPGGKLEMTRGESPVECARRELEEETGHGAAMEDFAVFGYVSEKAYAGTTHWLMFLVECRRPLASLPPAIPEGRFGFFQRHEIDGLRLPPSDRRLVWPCYDRYRGGFIALRADFDGDGVLDCREETRVLPSKSGNGLKPEA